jgi:hypothetical protein
MHNQRLILATLVGTAAQIAMVVGGHFVPAIKQAFMFGGLGLSLIAGVIYAAGSKGGWAATALGGAVAGGISAFLGIALSYLMGDVPASLMALGSLGSALTGVLGAAAARWLGAGKSAPTA